MKKNRPEIILSDKEYKYLGKNYGYILFLSKTPMPREEVRNLLLLNFGRKHLRRLYMIIKKLRNKL